MTVAEQIIMKSKLARQLGNELVYQFYLNPAHGLVPDTR
jgi:hypothetical protein